MSDLGLNDLKPNPGSTKNTKRLGRGKGSGQGKTAGRGHKGFNARSGGGVRPGYEGGQMPLYMRLGKLRGPHTPRRACRSGRFARTACRSTSAGWRNAFEAGAEVTPEALVAKRIVKNTRTPIKILGGGEVAVALTVRAHAFSEKAAEKIRAAGGTIELL